MFLKYTSSMFFDHIPIMTPDKSVKMNSCYNIVHSDSITKSCYLNYFSTNVEGDEMRKNVLNYKLLHQQY